MKNKEMFDKIASMYPEAELKAKYNNQIEIVIKPEFIESLVSTLKSIGFDHLSNITCVDWIDDNRIDVTYNIWSYKEKIHLTVKAGVDRNEPTIGTIMSYWPQAQVYERELHEMFGVVFKGNPNLTPLFLHNWKDIPPLRKDFDTEEYSKLAYVLKDVPDITQETNDTDGGNE